MAVSYLWTPIMDHRLALALLTMLLVFAAAPLAWGWARLLPEQRVPFEFESEESARDADSRQTARNPFAVCLLLLVTLSYLLKIPGVPVGPALQQWGSRVMPQDYLQWSVIVARAFFVVTPGLATAYGAFRKGPLRLPLLLSGVLVVALWLASPYLRAAIQM